MKEFIYKNISKLPCWMNNLFVKMNIFPLFVYGRAYFLYKTKLRKDKKSQEINLLNIVNYAVKNVDYYRELYGSIEFQSLSDFERGIGFIDKNLVMDNHERFINPNINLDKYDLVSTGGTSGKPLTILVSKNRYVVELGAVHNFWESYGFDFSRRAVLRNDKLKGKKFHINPITKEYIFDGFDLSDSQFKLIVDVMKKYNIRFLQCYPSSGYEFAKYLNKNQIETDFIDAFFVSSENIYTHHEKLYKEIGVEVFCLYGHSEKLVIAGSCHVCGNYRIEHSYGYLELVDEDNNVINETGKIGEIVGTTLNNVGMPLIRYKTGDFAEYANTSCKYCCENNSLKYVHGRWGGDKIYCADGSFVTTTALNLHNDIYQVIDGIQYVQNIKEELEVHLIANCLFTDDHENRILKMFNDRLSGGTKVTIKKVKAMRKQENGKFLLLISNVDV